MLKDIHEERFIHSGYNEGSDSDDFQGAGVKGGRQLMSPTHMNGLPLSPITNKDNVPDVDLAGSLAL